MNGTVKTSRARGAMVSVAEKTCDVSKAGVLAETSASTDMIRRYGRVLGGSRCKDTAPAGHWQTSKFRCLRANQLTAP